MSAQVAYGIMVHESIEAVARLFAAISDPHNLYLFHVDSKADPALHSAIQEIAEANSNVRLIGSQSVTWGGFSQVEVELRLMGCALEFGDWTHFVNLSGRDFPLRSQDSIRAELAKHIGTSFIGGATFRENWPAEDQMWRITSYFVEDEAGIRSLFPREWPFPEIILYGGPSWFVLAREFCSYVRESPDALRILDFYRNCALPDESVFQTIIWNSPFAPRTVSDCRRFTKWVLGEAHPRTLTSADLDEMLASGDFFARKFDAGVDAAVLGLLESAIGRPPG
jgi:hypothetical protein